MKIHFLLFLSLLLVTNGLGQGFKASGTWTGVVSNVNLDSNQTHPVYLEISAIQNHANGKIRIETHKEIFEFEVHAEFTNIKHLEFKAIGKAIKNSSKLITSTFGFGLTYVDSTGYFMATIVQEGHVLNAYKLILEKDLTKYDLEKGPIFKSYFVDNFLKGIKLGLVAQEKRKDELKSFEFQTIYFESDKSFLDPKYHGYLNKVARVVLSHSDLRIKVLGHTDGDGSDEYNDKLSEKRAEHIVAYLETRGVSADRIILDFKGEKQPVDTNDSENGKRKNRRVDIVFI